MIAFGAFGFIVPKCYYRLGKMAKASFSAYVLVKILLKTGEKVHFSTKKKHDRFWSSFLFLPFSLLLVSKWPTYAVFALQNSQKCRQKTRPPPKKWKLRSLDSLFKEVTVFKVWGSEVGSYHLSRNYYGINSFWISEMQKLRYGARN